MNTQQITISSSYKKWVHGKGTLKYRYAKRLENSKEYKRLEEEFNKRLETNRKKRVNRAM
jgi:hypothetical protein